MRVATIFAALLLVGCNQIAEFGNQAPACSASGTCEDGLVCVDKLCVEASRDEHVNPELEREADELAKLGVERDMLEARVQIANESVAEAVAELEDASSDEQRAAAAQKETRARAEQVRAEKALRSFQKKHPR